jgi:aminoglycoside phosphotransferase (APT) family kinase protein
MEAKPPSEVHVDAALVRALLRQQHPDLAEAPLVELGEGWDNILFRLGETFVVRLPRREASARLVEHEIRWLPQLASRVPLPVPAPVRVGTPDRRFPWHWTIVPWLGGQPALRTLPIGDASAARMLGRFLRALHQPGPADAPVNPWRGIPLSRREPTLLAHLNQLDGLVDRTMVLECFARASAAPAWRGPPLWIHGDLHPGNVLVTDGRLSGVIDFGDVTAGDPATDWSIAWMLFTAGARERFLDECHAGRPPSEADALVMRARGWAIALGAAYAAHSRDDESFRTLGLSAIDAALGD